MDMGLTIPRTASVLYNGSVAHHSEPLSKYMREFQLVQLSVRCHAMGFINPWPGGWERLTLRKNVPCSSARHEASLGRPCREFFGCRSNQKAISSTLLLEAQLFSNNTFPDLSNSVAQFGHVQPPHST